MMSGAGLLAVLFAAAFLLPSCLRNEGVDENQDLTVFCGSANKPAMEEIAALFEREKKIKVNMIFGGSGGLLSQIELSGRGEIYLPGSPDYFIIGKRKQLLMENSDRADQGLPRSERVLRQNRLSVPASRILHHAFPDGRQP